MGNNAFFGCSSLLNITILEGVNFIENYAFAYCTSLTSVTIPSSVISIGDYAFSGCSNLKIVTVSRKTTIGKDAFPDGVRIAYSD
jgi:hypothetical protein